MKKTMYCLVTKPHIVFKQRRVHCWGASLFVLIARCITLECPPIEEPHTMRYCGHDLRRAP